MSSFIRPEARAQLWRWRESLAGGAALVLGLIWALGPGGLIGWLGWALSLIGAALVVIGFQRGRFRGRSGGPGTVDVDEGQVTYFGPLTGGAVALRDLTDLTLMRAQPNPHWRLATKDGVLYIPVNADGADALFEAFTVLPGLKVQRMLSALNENATQDIVIWSRAPVRQPTDRLH